MMDISENEVHLWYVLDEEVTDPQLLSQYEDILTEQECVQQKRFHFSRHRHQFLLTRTLVRTVLSQYETNIAPKNWIFTKNAFGKPFVSSEISRSPLQFNLSHSDKMVIMAVTLNRSIGIDVEYLKRKGKTIEIADNFFSPIEVKQLLSVPVQQRNERFFDFWTLKEAYIKACGMGMSIPLNEFSYSLDQQGKISIEFSSKIDDHPALWNFWQLKLTNIHKISMALKSKNPDCSYAISVRKIVPLSSIQKIDSLISCGHVFLE
jgi:4'-phosphopantetheinyl transferase